MNSSDPIFFFMTEHNFDSKPSQRTLPPFVAFN